MTLPTPLRAFTLVSDLQVVPATWPEYLVDLKKDYVLFFILDLSENWSHAFQVDVFCLPSENESIFS